MATSSSLGKHRRTMLWSSSRGVAIPARRSWSSKLVILSIKESTESLAIQDMFLRSCWRRAVWSLLRGRYLSFSFLRA